MKTHPIEMAPKDGTPILIKTDLGYSTAKWMDCCNWVPESNWYVCAEGCEMSDRVDEPIALEGKILGWSPLPEISYNKAA